ncbi:MAG TPA: hypothetical protein VF653_11235 [Methylomirabilota bacterium]
MSSSRLALIALGAVGAVLALGWVLGHVMPPPYSGYLAFVVVGFVATQLYKRRPAERARRLFRVYLRARQRGADEEGARRQLVERGHDGTAPVWAGASERDRLIAAVAALLAGRGVTLERPALATAFERERDRFTIPGWTLLPPGFVEAVRGPLDERERGHLDTLMERYAVFRQRFFARPSTLGVDPGASVVDFARLLHSMGNRLTAEHGGDAERAYRLSLRMRPEGNLAHAGLALLLASTGRDAEAGREAKTALEVLDSYARDASARTPSTEDISPFKSPTSLREALTRLLAPAEGRGG